MKIAPRPCRRSPGAFTLIELLVVISIISVLVALLLPSLSAARRQAIQLQCGSNLRQLCIAFLAYDIDYKNFPPGSYNRGNAIRSWPANMVRTSVDILRESYKVEQRMVVCPEQKFSTGWNTAGTDLGSMDYWYQMGNGLRGAYDPPTTPADVTNIGNNRLGWFVGNYDPNEGYFPLTSVVKPQFFPTYKLPHSEQFVMLDLSFYRPSGSNFYPLIPNHMSVNSRAPRGTSVLFADGHSEWHVWDNPGRSWALSHSAVNLIEVGRMWWTPRSPKPPGAGLPIYE